ncbi:hypothetical protein PoMZ_08967 [Pyricularia oryzae]|uniref:Uncharacterized protein n=1 Tax=Pyricularia oryzae TaxID=318829 RepID=A0A4P7MVN2_PYROR|nr:hypothetical protein PoMZ_08967 [Pyricularia oryzae]
MAGRTVEHVVAAPGGSVLQKYTVAAGTTPLATRQTMAATAHPIRGALQNVL